MAGELRGKRIAAVVEQGFEQVELTEPRKALEAAGATVEVVSPQSGSVKGWQHTKWGDEIRVDRTLAEARPDDYDALLLPGGVMNPDHLRMDPAAVNFVRQFVSTGKPIAAICHGPWTLIEADALKGKTVTSWPSLKTDLKNAGATWVDQAVVTDGQFIFSRKPEDIPAFSKALIEALVHAPEHAHA